MKSLDVENVENVADAKAKVSDIKVFGNGDLFILLSKASSESQGWMKSTKGMNVPGGCLVQVSTQQRNPDGSWVLAEALSFCPGVVVDRIGYNPPRIIKYIDYDAINAKSYSNVPG